MPWGEEDRFPEQLQSQIEALGMRGAQAAVNFREDDSARKIMDEVEARLGRADILINNATHDDFDTRRIKGPYYARGQDGLEGMKN